MTMFPCEMGPQLGGQRQVSRLCPSCYDAQHFQGLTIHWPFGVNTALFTRGHLAMLHGSAAAQLLKDISSAVEINYACLWLYIRASVALLTGLLFCGR